MKIKTSNNGVALLVTVLMIAPVIQVNSHAAHAASIQVSSKDTAEDIARKIKEVEKSEFSVNNYFGKTKLTKKNAPIIDKNELGYKYIKGTKNILISAPHTLKQPARPGKSDYKVADAYTGGIAQYVAKKTGAHVIYKTSYTGVDDNFKGYGISNPTKEQTRTPYRDKVEDIIKENQIALVIDVHGFADDKASEYGVEFGTNKGGNLLKDKELLNEILGSFEDNGFAKLGSKKSKNLSANKVYAVDEKYSASFKNRTLTNYVSTSLKTPAIQIEFSRTNRDPKNTKDLQRTVDTLADVVNNVSNLVDIREKNSAQIKDVSKYAVLRKSASDSSSEVAKINKDSYVKIIENTNSTWSKVKYGSKIGYIKTKNLSRVGQVTNVKSYLNFREEANANSTAIARIHENECVTILKEYKNGWLKVSYGGTEGYVSGKYIKNVDPNTIIKDEISKIHYVNKKTVTGVKSGLNLREQATSSSNSITKIKNGEKVSIVKQVNSTWVKVAYKNNIGYVSTKYLK